MAYTKKIQAKNHLTIILIYVRIFALYPFAVVAELVDAQD